MEKLIRTILSEIIEDEESLKISIEEKENETVVTINASEKDLGRIIGRSGRTANAIRTILRSMYAKGSKKVFVDIA